MRHMSPSSLPPCFAFSPPRYPVFERSNLYEFDPPPKPYSHPTLLPPPPPPPPRENIPLRIVHDYPKRNPVFEDENFPRRIDNTRELPENWDRNLRWGAMEARSRVPDIDVGGRGRYRDVISESFESYRNRDDERRWDSGISDWGGDLENRRNYDERRWDSGMNDPSRGLYREHDYDERRWDSGMNDRSRDLYREHYFDERRWDSRRNDQGRELYCLVDDDERRWDSSRSAGVLSRLGNRLPDFAEDDDLSLGGVLSRLGNRQPEFTEHGLSSGGVLSRLGNRQSELAEDDLSLGRFSGRLGTGAGKGEFNRPDKKKRLQKKNTLHRIQLGKVRSRHSGGFKPRHFAEESSRGSFKLREKGSGKMQIRMEGRREREQSPVELAISFKSNALVAKAIQVPYHSSVEPCVKSKSAKERLGCNVSALPAAKNDVASDLQSDSQGTSKDHLDEAAVSERGGVTVNNAGDLGENILKNAHLEVMSLKGPNMVRSGEAHSNCLRKKKRAMEQLLLEPNLRMVKDSHNISADACKPFVPKPKRKRSSLNKTPSSLYVGDDVITKCSGRAEGLVTTIGNADHVRQLSTDEDPCHAHESLLPNENTDSRDSLGFNQHVNTVNKYLRDRASVLDAEKGAKYIKLDSDMVEGVSEHSVLGEEVLLESSSTEGPSEDIVPVKDHDTGVLSRPQETQIFEVHEDNYISEIQELVSSLKSDCAVMQMSEDAFVSDVGSQDANSEDFFPNQANVPQVLLDAKGFRSLEGAAVADCSNVAFDTSVSSRFLSANDRETLPEFDVSFPNNVVTDLSCNIDSVEGSPEVISDRETCLSVDNSFPKVISDRETCLTIDNSSKVIRKRKDRGAQLDLSGTKTGSNVATDRSIGGEVTRPLTKDIVPAVAVDIIGQKDSCKEVTGLKKVPSRLEDSLLEFHFSANGSFPGYRKKQKLSSPRSSLSSLSEDDTIADGHSTLPILEQHATKPSECGAEQSEDTSSASTTMNQCGTTDVEGEVDINDIYVGNLVDGDRSHGNDDIALIASGISCSDGNGLTASNSGDELLASEFDMRSCMTSPEELHAYSDLSFSGNTKASACLSDSEMICRSDNISNKKPVIADPNTGSFGNCLEALKKSQSNADIPQSLHKGTSQVVKKLYPLPGKLTWSKNQLTSAATKFSPAHHPSSFSNTRKLYSSHATKSRTWSRTGNSTVAVAEPKVKPSPVPQSNGTKAGRSIQSSYIRKGNSLVRKPSTSCDTSPGFHGSSCSVYRLSHCTSTMKNNLATDNKTGDGDAPPVKRTGQATTSEMTKALTLNHSGNSLSCTPGNLEEPLPVRNPHKNGCPSKTLDVMEEKIKSSLVPECQTDSVINSDSQSTCGEGGDSEKKITYVKRRSYQLVATSNSDDMSILGVDTNQSQSSDGYYKSRENQLVRASSENQVERGNANANANASRLVPHSIIPKTSGRRQSGFAKTCRHSKFSFVWKLHDTPSLEKCKNSLGPLKVWPHLFKPKRAAYWRNLILGIKPSLSTISQKLLVSRKRGAVYTRSSHGYSLKMSKVLSVGGSSLKWSKSIEKNSKKANEEATRAVAAAEKRKKEETGAVPLASKRRNHVSRERIFRIGSERYKMDATRRTLHRITDKESSSSVALQSEKNVKRSYIPRRFLIGNEEYIRIGNGNQLIRDPKKRTRVLASEKVRWSLRTARLRLARKRKYCQFFTRFGKCNKDDGKCPYIHDPSKIVVCTKFLAGSCTNIDCKLTHKVIPERMQDCSYFLKGSCSNDNCPYRHVHVNPDSTVCESFLRGYCADGNECQKKHTYVCPAFEATGVCPQVSTCKLHHPKKKTEKKPTSEQKIVRGRYFDGGLIEVADCSAAPTEKLSPKGKDDIVVDEGKFPDYISLDVSDDEAEQTEKDYDETLPDAQIEDLRASSRIGIV
ncbi:hypothetical protein C2S53_007704 [Perilla frutescens var. hirtella]|uniref:C3H1-type domain-containing protein n=1 Tax=Perilla frutescens var. hirtella TaxID=608512 RepID=A0AAD4JF10_PERFH|nr:hypothetical protein C2S53_007704 [Perilla frutescens var. hirtella]